MLLPLLLTALIAPARAQNHAIVGGGGCVEAAKGQSYFDEQTRFQHDAFSAMPGWSSERLFGGGDGADVEPFTEAKLLASIGYRRDRDTGRIVVADPNKFRSGDQVVLSITTHGMGGAGMSGHSICLDDNEAWSVRQLKGPLDELARRGVHVAVLDSSCYSGGSVRELGGDGVCVVSGTLDGLTATGSDLPMSVVAQALPAAERARLLKAHPAVFPNAGDRRNFETNRPDLDGDGKLSLEEAFLADRVASGTGQAHGPAQISSDVEGRGFALGQMQGFDFSQPNPARKVQEQDADQTRALYEGFCYATSPFASIEEFFHQIRTVTTTPEDESDRRVLRAAMDRLGFRGRQLADVEREMHQLIARRTDLYRRVRAATDEYARNHSAAALARLQALNIEDARSLAGDRYRRLERIYYLGQYLQQRRTTHAEAKARACSEFKF